MSASGAAEPGVFRIEVDCSSGTYVRVLAADLGAALGGGAHLRNLRRTGIGSFTVALINRMYDRNLVPSTAAASLLIWSKPNRPNWRPRSKSWSA